MFAATYEEWRQQLVARSAADRERKRTAERDRARRYRSENRAALNAFKIVKVCDAANASHLSGAFIAMNASPRLVADALDAYDDDDQALAAVREAQLQRELASVDPDELWSTAIDRARNAPRGTIRPGER